ncbi:MAG TPA: sigma-70 family RNA polymerase sigma factor [Bryobacteraceae bacterium]|nr:sigma-70 family RNA polymerase sigma factor [Bryobacteraceae bacterium]
MRCASSELEDFDTVVRLHRARVFRFALASLRDRDAAETVTQDCFMRAYHARDRFRGDASLTTWLMQIAVNLVRDHARNRRLQFWKRTQASAVDLESASERILDRDSSPEARALANEQLRAVWSATERLPDRQRTVFLLRFVEDMDILEIAAATGMKEGTVKVHLFRALQAVRERIGSRV